MFAQFLFSKRTVFIIVFMFCHWFASSQTPADSLKENRNIPKKIPLKSVTGIASFYSKSLNGSKTATGERFYHNGNTAASNFFKLNTWVRITNLRNDNTTIVRINDRMAKRMAKRGRVIDVSRSTAKKLGFLHRGLARVKVEKVPKGTEE
ncbi:MAG: septal ring lytic transglycosylase RlpA family protein [Chitinophagaceae bacterium]|jgi:rare lipoprotein A|nr:septal ring lytic transglycosylase RlpA family protein [Chitinophagaceae bacterium]